MSALPDHGAAEDRSGEAPDHDVPDVIPEWAPPEPLPSSEMFLDAFSGSRPVTAGDILHPAFDLVECQREFRLAFEVLAEVEVPSAVLRAAVKKLVTAQADIEMLITIIDDAVAQRLRQRRASDATTSAETAQSAQTPMDRLPTVMMHTESIGQIAARMADLWERSIAEAKEQVAEELPEAHELMELCAGYDCLAAEIESGRRVLPWM